jgi:7,8-dihydro-6-hydroxymethylpterin-pyrophosphokinase
VPHPEAPNRLFVLAPLADLAPGLRPPGWDQTVARARDRQLAKEGAGAVKPLPEELWQG